MPSVLVVDDSLTVRMDLLEIFEAAGFHAVPSATLAEARAALAREPFGLVVLDVRLPDGDGTELLREIREAHGTSVRVMMLSSEVEVHDRIRSLTKGADEYVGKPYDGDYVVSRARELLAMNEAPQRGPSSVLVIDDSTTFLESLRETFEAEGYQVLTAGSGEEGLRIAADQRPAAIVVDGMLPGIDGATVLRRIRLDAALRGTPCMLLTAADDRDAELRALDAGADAFVRKQADSRVVLARFSAMLRNVHGRDEGPLRASLLGPKRVLAVDDSASFLDVLSTALRGEGYDVVIARSGEEALDLLAVQSVDFILLDLMMPGWGGEETCRRIKAVPELREVPLIMLTASEDREAMLAGLSAGADDYIPKSSDFEVLRARMRAQLRRRQFEDENRNYREQLLTMKLEAAEARAAREIAETRARLVEELEDKNRELEAFSYSVSHDLRAPLRAIEGFSHLLLEDCYDKLDERGRNYLDRVRSAATRMGELIEDLLGLSRVGRAELHREAVDLTSIAQVIGGALGYAEPGRQVAFVVQEGLVATCDRGLARALLENLLGNAWKFTARVEAAQVELGAAEVDGVPAYFVRDNGAGFDPRYADKLFAPFQRLHAERDFPGTGIGLATVRRIVERHGGQVWAEGEVGKGATIRWTFGAPSSPESVLSRRPPAAG